MEHRTIWKVLCYYKHDDDPEFMKLIKGDESTGSYTLKCSYCGYKILLRNFGDVTNQGDRVVLAIR